MRLLTAITLLFLSLQLSAQDLLSQLQGEWIKYKIEMKDGSRLYSRQYNDSSYIKFSFKGNVFSILTKPVEPEKSTETHVSVIDSIIKLSQWSSYKIEKISKDTLVLVENFEETEDKLKRYFCVNQQTLLDRTKKLPKNDTYKANRYNHPILIEPVDIAKVPNVVFKVKGKLQVDLLSKDINVVIESDSTDTNYLLRTISKILEDSYENWDFTNFNGYKFIEIPFFAQGREVPNQKRKTVLNSIDFIVEPFDYQKDSSPATLKQLADSTELYKKGLVAFKNSDLQSAVKYFTESYENDNYNIEALYSRAAINYHLGNKDEACKDWSILSELGQKRGITSHNQYCTKQ